MTRIPLWAGLLVLACAVVLGAGSASAKSAGNHTFWNDPPNDNQHGSTSNNYASDIRSIDITSQDNGDAHFAVTLADFDARLVTGDELDVYINYDRNRSTGDRNGADLDLYAKGGPASSGTSFLLCHIGAQRSCEDGPSGWANDKPTSTPGQHVVDFSLINFDVAAFDFFVQEGYTQPGQSATLYDWAPDTGYWTYETKADPDHDGLYGSADECSFTPAGKFDPNHNGCPGRFAFISEGVEKCTTVHVPGYLELCRYGIRVKHVPARASVVFLSPYKGVGRIPRRANDSGVARWDVTGNFRFGSIITIRITKLGYIGRFLQFRAEHPGLRLVRRSCIPPNQPGGAPIKCSRTLRGS